MLEKDRFLTRFSLVEYIENNWMSLWRNQKQNRLIFWKTLFEIPLFVWVFPRAVLLSSLKIDQFYKRIKYVYSLKVSCL